MPFEVAIDWGEGAGKACVRLDSQWLLSLRRALWCEGVMRRVQTTFDVPHKPPTSPQAMTVLGTKRCASLGPIAAP